MMTSQPIHEPLSDAEVDTLAGRLQANANPGSLQLESVDGLFCALIASPTLVLPSVYWSLILGGEPGDSRVFADSQDATQTPALVTRFWNTIVADFNAHEPIHMPYIEEPGTDKILGRDWARGFILGTQFSPGDWKRLFSDKNEELALTIPIVAGEVDPAWPKAPLTAEQNDENLKWMIAAAARAYRYFADDRRAHSQSGNLILNTQAPVRRNTIKTGRNDACPCGSGKKFKRCCGGSATLH